MLKPIQIAFIAGEKMHRATPLDEEFIDTCGNFDLKKVKELVAEGANIHAVDQNGDTAMSTMMMSYYGNPFGEQLPPDNGNHDNFIKIAQYLLSLGYNINLAGYDAGTCLNDAPHIDMEIVKFLLDNGADPNVGSHIGDNGGEILGRTVLAHVWDDEIAHKEENFDDLERLLLSYGALPIPAGQRITPDELDDWIKEEREKKQWDDSICLGSSNFNDALLNCAGNMNFYYMALIAQSGGDVNVRDARGRSLLQITLDEAELTERNKSYFQIHLAEMALMLLCGLKLKLSAEEIEWTKATCREKGYTEALDAITSVVPSTIGLCKRCP